MVCWGYIASFSMKPRLSTFPLVEVGQNKDLMVDLWVCSTTFFRKDETATLHPLATTNHCPRKSHCVF
jgi:hypothetical protein